MKHANSDDHSAKWRKIWHRTTFLMLLLVFLMIPFSMMFLDGESRLSSSSKNTFQHHSKDERIKLADKNESFNEFNAHSRESSGRNEEETVKTNSMTRWTLAMSPIVINTIHVVPSGSTLIIDPGVIIKFGKDGGMYVEGRLIANGTARDPILFTRDASTTLNWTGKIVFRQSSGISNITHAIFEHGVAGTYEGIIEVRQARVFFSGCTFRYNEMGYGVITVWDHGSVVVTHSVFHNNTNTQFRDNGNRIGVIDFGWGYGSDWDAGEGVIKQSVFVFNTAFAIDVFLSNTMRGVYIRNNIIAFNSGDVVLSGTIDSDYNDLWQNQRRRYTLNAHDMELDPRFVDASNYNFTVLSSSPCLGAGDDGEDIGLSGNYNFAPQAYLPNNETTLNVGTVVPLNGTNSWDPDGTIQWNSWTQLSGPSTASIINGSNIVAHAQLMQLGTYEFTLEVSDGDKSGNGTISFTVNNGIPPAPKEPIVLATSSHSITLTWDSVPISDIIGYNVYRSTSYRGPFEKLGVVTPTTNFTTFTDNTVQDGMQYYYMVTSVDNLLLESNVSLTHPASAPNNVIVSTQVSMAPNVTDLAYQPSEWDGAYTYHVFSRYSNLSAIFKVENTLSSLFFLLHVNNLSYLDTIYFYISTDGNYRVDGEDPDSPYSDIVLSFNRTSILMETTPTGWWTELQPTSLQPPHSLHVFPNNSAVYEVELPLSIFSSINITTTSRQIEFGLHLWGDDYWFGNEVRGGGFGSASGILQITRDFINVTQTIDQISICLNNCSRYITWNVTTYNPKSYQILVDDVLVLESFWNGNPITVDINDYINTTGIYNFTMIAYNWANHFARATTMVHVLVNDTQPPIIISLSSANFTIIVNETMPTITIPLILNVTDDGLVHSYYIYRNGTIIAQNVTTGSINGSDTVIIINMTDTVSLDLTSKKSILINYTIIASDSCNNDAVLQVWVNVTIQHALSTPVITYPNGDETLNGTITITWQASTDSWGHQATYTLYYTTDAGNNWNLLASDITATNYDWDTTTVPDGTTYLLKVVSYDGHGFNIEDTSDGTFSIQNSISSSPTTTTSTVSSSTTTTAIPSSSATTTDQTSTFPDDSSSDNSTRDETEAPIAPTTIVVITPSFSMISTALLFSTLSMLFIWRRKK